MGMTAMQGHEAIPWAVHLRIYEQYAKRYGTNQSALRIAERGGFSVGEADELYPSWRSECEELPMLRARVRQLEVERISLRESIEEAHGTAEYWREEARRLDTDVERLGDDLDAFARDADKKTRMTTAAYWRDRADRLELRLLDFFGYFAPRGGVSDVPLGPFSRAAEDLGGCERCCSLLGDADHYADCDAVHTGENQ